jgi:glucose/arabinose dehydrogenase
MVGKELLISVIAAGAIVFAAVMFSLTPNNPVEVDTAQSQEEKEILPKLHDDTLGIELVTEGLEFPTSMRFLDANNILVLQKDDGKVLLVPRGQPYNQTVLQVRVANEAERGLLGVAIWNNSPNYNTTVFLYFTEIVDESSDSENLRNRVYKYSYDWNEKILTNQTLILDLPGEPGPFHNGGKIAIGPYDGYLYAVIGDVNAGGGILDNEISGRDPDDKSVILRVDKETGLPAESNPFIIMKS